MKKTLLSLLAVVGFAFAANAAEVTLDFSTADQLVKYGFEKPAEIGQYGEGIVVPSVTIEGVKLTFTQADGAQEAQKLRFFFAQNGSADLRVSAKGGALKPSMTVAMANGQNVTKIEFTASKLAMGASPATLTGKTWEGDAAAVTFTTSGQCTITKMVITYGGAADTRKDAGMSFPETEYTAELGKAFTAPVLTKATTAAVTYESDKATVATVDATTGAVTIVGEGTARITAKAEANDEYKAGTASYLLKVKIGAPANAIYWSELGADFTFEMNDIEGLENKTVWSHDKTYGLKATAYVSGKNYAVGALAVSPVIDLTDAKSAKLDFKNAFNQYKLNGTMIDPKDFDGYAMFLVGEEGKLLESEPQALITAPTAFNWDFFPNASISLDQYVGKKIQFGFYYVATEEVAGTWEIKHIAVTGDKSGVEVIEAVDANAPVEYFNLQGVRVANPENGLFIRRQGSKVAKVLVK